MADAVATEGRGSTGLWAPGLSGRDRHRKVGVSAGSPMGWGTPWIRRNKVKFHRLGCLSKTFLSVLIFPTLHPWPTPHSPSGPRSQGACGNAVRSPPRVLGSRFADPLWKGDITRPAEWKADPGSAAGQCGLRIGKCPVPGLQSTSSRGARNAVECWNDERTRGGWKGVLWPP